MQHHNLLAKTAAAFRTFGNVTLKTIVEMVLMKETSVQKKLVLTSNSLALELVTVFRNHGFVMEMTIASTSR